ncbi:cation:proton antiporter [Eubacteriaceae bacterium ES3]|nr:cation:proton antiporter [Eubacteriaceae bacterium ES3]
MYKFSELLILFTVTLFFVVLFSFINEKTLKLPYEIGLVVFGFGFCLILILIRAFDMTLLPEEFLKLVHQFDFNDFLIHGILCFMLFSGASSIKFNDFNEDKGLIGRMAIFGTLISIIVYGFLFYGLSLFLGLNLTILESLILGAIIAPSDPISAMSILGNVGLPHRLSLILEGESLFNDGIAVAVFATLIAIQAESTAAFLPGSFIGGLVADIAGAVIIGLLIGLVMFQIFKHTKNLYIKIFTSILTVMMAYLICEYFEFSGPIAAVICGLYYATVIAGLERQGMDESTRRLHDMFYDFWGVIDNLLNGILFLMVGLLFFAVISLEDISHLPFFAILIGAIAINTISRIISVAANVSFQKNMPLGLSKKNFTVFFSWAGLKGGLCLALVMGTEVSLSPHTYSIFVVATYGIVFFTTVFQGLTVGKIFKKLQKSEVENTHDVQ